MHEVVQKNTITIIFYLLKNKIENSIVDSQYILSRLSTSGTASTGLLKFAVDPPRLHFFALRYCQEVDD